ncbi:hypothetical protein HAX54_045024 [Datura stramonium]|uniref:Protein kinase domain-containing protein n=1 Tax=Datura stramonium TaxID=4076 RepID=A0ABS8SQB5_DATST|nr:hypothetical protein [Datura stramonium]
MMTLLLLVLLLLLHRPTTFSNKTASPLISPFFFHIYSQALVAFSFFPSAFSILRAFMVKANMVVILFIIIQEIQKANSVVESTKNFSFSELKLATNNFHQTNKIGRGGFWHTVYKGTLRNGKEIAVKTLVMNQDSFQEFLTEIETISNVRHPNLVEIIGCCADGNNRILVYEYLENRSLDQALFGSRTSIKLEWDKRATICLLTAQDNITHISTKIAGTTGYYLGT